MSEKTSDETSRRYVLNRKCFAAARALGRGKDADPKWQFLFVSPKGVIATDKTAVIRVSLPVQPQDETPLSPQVFTREMFEPVAPKTADELVTMPEGLEAKSTGTLSIPNFNSAIPEPSAQVASITVTAKHLIEVLKAACEVTEHSRYLVTLRICGDGNKSQTLRVDAHRDEDGQEFCAAVMGTFYTGSNIPGEPQAGDKNVVEHVEERKLNLPLTEGRKFRHGKGE